MNLFIVFLVSGLWHGASWTFVIWGALHGTYLIVEIWLSKLAARLIRATRLAKLQSFINPKVEQNIIILLRRIVVFGFVMVAWIFFRAQTVQDAFYIVSHLSIANANLSQISMLMGGNIELFLAFVLIAGLFVVEAYQQNTLAVGGLRQQIQKLPAWARFVVYYSTIMLILILGKFFNAEADFIYFQF